MTSDSGEIMQPKKKKKSLSRQLKYIYKSAHNDKGKQRSENKLKSGLTFVKKNFLILLKLFLI